MKQPETPYDRPSEVTNLGRHAVGPLTLSAATVEQALAFTGHLVRLREAHYFCFCEANLLSSALAQTVARRAVNGATAVFADGVGVWWLARLHGIRLPQRISGPAFMLAACCHGVSRKWRHFFCGGEPGVSEALSARLKRQFPGLEVAGTASPPFGLRSQRAERRLVERINASDVDLLWVALGSPQQEIWAARFASDLKVGVILPVGAAFDFHSGNRRWAPPWVRAAGLEWAFRALTGGRRIFFRNARCVAAMGAVLAYAVVKKVAGKLTGEVGFPQQKALLSESVAHRTGSSNVP